MNLWAMTGQIQRENGIWWCEVKDADGQKRKGCTNKHDEGHHGIFEAQRAHKEREWRRFLDHPVNYTASCHGCNVNRVGDPEAARDHRFDAQVERYGAQAVRLWLMKAPLDIQERHTWKRYWSRVNE